MKKQRSKQHSIVISGYYGYGSIGDEAVLFSILSGIAERLPGAKVCVLCADRDSLPDIAGITLFAKSRTNPFSVISALLGADLFISGGGSLMQDATSSRSLSYYCALLHLAKLCGCKIYVYANGIGPLKNEKKCRCALLLADLISVRDRASHETVKRLTKESSPPVLSADPVFAHPFPNRRTLFLRFSAGHAKMPYFAVSLRSCKSSGTVNLKELEVAISALSKDGYFPVFVSMQDCYDLEICQTMAEMTGGAVASVGDGDELYCLLEKASFAVGMRLHFLLTAALAGTPLVALSYDCKVEGCLEELAEGFILSAFDFSKEELLEAVCNARKSFSRRKTEEICLRLRSLALRDMDGILTLLEKDENKASAGEKFFADT
ncbi:MAG: polysaccharide pyruvyl transferase CsaB [Ruminococcaceae bacterium]|nr:polysaccharide pyruvyl transferase CsaB [Oscillospiraceae bacterium]